MEIDQPHESDGSTNGSKESETFSTSDCHSGIGLPYAPEDFPEAGDKWYWKVGKRVTLSGNYVDRYLYLPDRLHKEFKSKGHAYFATKKGFASKLSVERFIIEVFPGTDVKAFFNSFTWKIPAGKAKGNKENISDQPIYAPKFDPLGCKAGNINCSSLKTNNSNPINSNFNIMDCDICCIEPLFCRDCCCILCSRTVNSLNSDHAFIKCEATIKTGFICGHICHIECGVRSYMAGTVGGSIGLDAEYYCRRCDARADLVPHVQNLLKSCESIRCGEKMHKILNLCVVILRGSSKSSAKSLLDRVQYAMGKLKEGNVHEDIWKLEDTSAVTTGDLSQNETDTIEVSNFNEPSKPKTSLPQPSFTNIDSQLEPTLLDKKIEKTLASVKKSQETESNIAEDVLVAQKKLLQNLYKELEKEKTKLAKCSPSADPSLVHGVFKRMDEIKNEFDKVNAMQAVGKGFGKTSKYVLKEHFGVKADN